MNVEREEHFPLETNYVYILGAGASYADDKRFPLMKSVFEGFQNPRENSNKSWAEIYPNLLNWLKQNYSDYRSANIEEILTYLDFLRDDYIFDDIPYTAEAIRNELNVVNLELVEYLQKRLNPKSNINNFKLHNALAKKLKPEDSIISLNYDEIIETVLIAHNRSQENIKKLPQLLNLQYLISKISNRESLFSSLGFNFQAEDGPGYLLKLHGSLFWTSCATSNCPNRFYINMSNEDHIIENEEEYYKNPGFDYFPNIPAFCEICGGKLEKIFIYPTAFKQFNLFPKLRVIWQKAYRILENATHYVLIGYSLPETDYHVRNLIRKACFSGKGRSWRIVDPDWKKVLKRLKPLIEDQGNSVTFFLRCYKGFEEFLNDEHVEGVDYEDFWNF
ncbi:MAG: hypothetical protein GF353_11505 [Candidatus Lokiarchaeota archaeon]|nr:hypothetical protein [Candidatus Lokiarchaeota archaeon]